MAIHTRPKKLLFPSLPIETTARLCLESFDGLLLGFCVGDLLGLREGLCEGDFVGEKLGGSVGDLQQSFEKVIRAKSY